jgi:hypothetical protein
MGGKPSRRIYFLLTDLAESAQFTNCTADSCLQINYIIVGISTVPEGPFLTCRTFKYWRHREETTKDGASLSPMLSKVWQLLPFGACLVCCPCCSYLELLTAWPMLHWYWHWKLMLSTSLSDSPAACEQGCSKADNSCIGQLVISTVKSQTTAAQRCLESDRQQLHKTACDQHCQESDNSCIGQLVNSCIALSRVR